MPLTMRTLVVALAAPGIVIGCTVGSDAPAPGGAGGAGGNVGGSAGTAGSGGMGGSSGIGGNGGVGGSGGTAGSGGSGGAGGSADAGVGSQIPPTTGAADMETWLAAGYYKSWHCEMQASAKTAGAVGIHVHGTTRICSNDALSGFGGTGEFPAGASAVKELWDSANTHVVGHSVYTHTAAGDGTTCAHYFYYERFGTGAPIIGLGNSTCTSCHGAAGSNAAHLAPTAHDCVYTIIR